MSEIYKMTLEDGSEKFIPSKDYIDIRLKNIKDNIFSKTNTGVMDNTSIIDINNNEDNSIAADRIVQDASHRFLTDTQITDLKNKVSVYELQKAIQDAVTHLRGEFNQIYTKLLNSPSSVEDLKAALDLLEDYKDITNEFKTRVSMEEFNSHKADESLHISSTDRSNLDILKNAIDDNLFSLINDAGNHSINADYADYAKTIDGSSIDDIKDYAMYDLVFSVTGENKMTTVFTPEHDIFSRLSSKCIGFKNGIYRCHGINITPKYSLYIDGSSNTDTKFVIDTMYIGNTTIRDFNMEIGNIFTSANTVFDNVVFNKSTITVDGFFNRFTNCKFINCKFDFSYVRGLIITNCIFDGCNIPKIISPAVSIANNIKI